MLNSPAKLNIDKNEKPQMCNTVPSRMDAIGQKGMPGKRFANGYSNYQQLRPLYSCFLHLD
jgi:hypothetical protein